MEKLKKNKNIFKKSVTKTLINLALLLSSMDMMQQLKLKKL